MRSLRTALKGSPCSPELEKACAKQQRPNAARNKYINTFKFKKKKSHFNTHSPEIQREVGESQQEIYILIPLNWLTNIRGCHLVPGTQPRPGSSVSALSDFIFKNSSFLPSFLPPSLPSFLPSFLPSSALGLGCGMWDLVLGPGIEPRPLALGAWGLSRWTAREVPALSYCGGCIHEDPFLVGIFKRSVSGCQFQLCSRRTSIPLLSINTCVWESAMMGKGENAKQLEKDQLSMGVGVGKGVCCCCC